MRNRAIIGVFFLVILTMLSFASCGGGGGTVIPPPDGNGDDNGNGPSVRIDISVTRSSIDFGEVEVGHSMNSSLSISNDSSSTDTLTGEAGISSGTSVFAIISGGGSFNLPAGQSKTVTIRFSPSSTGDKTGTLRITHNATNKGSPISVTLSGEGVQEPQPPNPPTNVQASDGTYADKIRITWTASSGADYYKLYRSTSQSGTYGYIGQTSSSPYDDNPGNTNTYWYKAKAHNANGDSDFSNADSGRLKNQPPVIDSMSVPSSITSGGSVTVSCTAHDPNGDPLTYSWDALDPEVPGGWHAIPGSSSSLTYTASEVTVPTGVAIRVVVSDGELSDTETAYTTVEPHDIHNPVIDSMTVPPTIPSGESRTVSCTAHDPDGDSLTYSWSDGGAGGNFSGSGNGVTYNAPTVSTDTTVTISVTASDGELSDSDSRNTTVTHVPPEYLDRIAVTSPSGLPGSGTSDDPYILQGQFQVQFRAYSNLDSDLTTMVTWCENSTDPGTGFDEETEGMLYVSPFDFEFKVWATYSGHDSNDLFFRVQPPD
ncbi:choice-of-anchor D domain-containing protein [bacterium]|nr:choice-of-anchor D domain-containing protein [bacterium]